MSKFSITYHKRNLIDLGDFSLGEQNDELTDPYKISDLQQYNPTYSLFFDLTEKNYNQIALNHHEHIVNLETVMDMNTKEIKKKKVFIKFSPLLDPIRYMIGKYDLKDEKLKKLPRLSSTEEICSKKLLESSNASYVDNFFYFLTSVLLNNHGFHHGVNYYGSFLGIQNKFKMNIEDDLEYLTGSSFFLDNIGKLMTLENFNAEDIYCDKYNTRKCKSKLIINTIEETVKIVVDEEIESDLENDLVIHQEVSAVPGEVIYEKPKLTHDIQDDEISDDSSIDTSDNSDLNYSTCSDIDISRTSNSSVDGFSDDESSSTEEKDDTFAYINDFPVQMICLEKLECTLDELFLKEEIDEQNGSAIFFQIIMTLLVYQKVFDFTPSYK